MGRKWNNIKYGKAAKDSARSKILARYGKEIYVAAKSGDPDPDLNRNLAMVIERAKIAGVNREIIDRAVNKAKGGSEEKYDAVRYEGYGPSGSAIIVDTLTDNVNRTVAEVRSAFKKNSGNIGVSGSVAFMFQPSSVFTFSGKSSDEVLEGLMEADVDVRDVVEDEEFVTVIADFDQFHAVQVALNDMGITQFEEAELNMMPNSTVQLEGEALDDFMDLIEAIEDVDDVQQVFHNVEMK